MHVGSCIYPLNGFYLASYKCVFSIDVVDCPNVGSVDIVVVILFNFGSNS